MWFNEKEKSVPPASYTSCEAQNHSASGKTAFPLLFFLSAFSKRPLESPTTYRALLFARLETYHAPGYPEEYVLLHAENLAEITGRITLSWETAGSNEICVTT